VRLFRSLHPKVLARFELAAALSLQHWSPSVAPVQFGSGAGAEGLPQGGLLSHGLLPLPPPWAVTSGKLVLRLSWGHKPRRDSRDLHGRGAEAVCRGHHAETGRGACLGAGASAAKADAEHCGTSHHWAGWGRQQCG